MKKYINILFAATVAALTMLSCQPKEEPYEAGPKEADNCYGVYFPTQDASGSHVYNPTQDKSMEITLKRTNTKGAITVPMTKEFSEEGIFTVTDATFADGQDETTFTVRFDKAEEGVEYKASFVIEDNNYASIYNSGAIALDFSFMCVEMQYFKDPKTGEKALVTFNQGWWGEVATGYIKYYEVNGVRTCFTETIDHLYNGVLTEAPGFWGYGEDYEWTFYWYPKESHPSVPGATLIQLPWQPSGYVHSSVGMVYLGDYICEQNFWGKSYDWMEEAKSEARFVASYYDGNGGFYFNVYAYANEAGSGWAADPFETVGIASGFTRVDYSLSVDADYSDEGVTPVYVEAGVDVANIKYAVYEGELNSAQLANKVEAISKGTEEGVTTFSEFELDEEEGVKYATLEVELDKTGNYTIVAVAFDEKGNPQTDANDTFRYVSAEDSEEFAVDLNVFTEDTPERYVGLHDYDSFAFGIYGSDLTDVHVGIFDASKVYADPDAYFDAVKVDEKGDYAVSADALAEINGLGGLYEVVNPAPANTELIVLVWATNGNLDKFAYATYTTAKLPYVWNSLGKGQFTDDVMTLFDEEDDPLPPFTVSCDVYEEASTPGLYMITGYQLPLVAQIFGVSEEVMADYEGTYWKNTELIIDATNPEKVFIDSQEYGCRISADGWMWVTSVYNGSHFSEGTLKDGVITFPTKGMLCGFDGAIRYYANMNGAFKVVLNAGASTTSVAPANVSNTLPEKDYTFKGWMAQLPTVEPMKYERDPQARMAKVTVSYDRKEKESGRNQPATAIR